MDLRRHTSAVVILLGALMGTAVPAQDAVTTAANQSPLEQTGRSGLAVMGRLPETAFNRALKQYLAQRVGLKHMVQAYSVDEFFTRLATLSREGPQYDFLIILGHGSRDFPHITLNQHEAPGDPPEEALSPRQKDFDVDHHQEFMRKFLLGRETDKSSFFNLLYKPNRTADDELNLDLYRSRLENSDRILTDRPVGFVASQQALAYYDGLRDLLTENASVLILNCSAAATDEHMAFVRNIGRVLLARRGGRINGSRTDLQVFTAYADRDDALIGLQGFFNWVMTMIQYGGAVQPGDVAVRGSFLQSFASLRTLFLGNWYTVTIPADPAAPLYNSSLFVDFEPQVVEVPHGAVAKLNAVVRRMPDSGALTYLWEFGRQATSASTFAVDTWEYEPGRLVKIKVAVRDERGRTGESWGYVWIAKPNYAPVIDIAPANPRTGDIVGARVRMTKDAAPAEAMWRWSAGGGVTVAGKRDDEANIEVAGRGTIRAQLYRLTRFGREEVLTEAQVEIVPSGPSAAAPLAERPQTGTSQTVPAAPIAPALPPTRAAGTSPVESEGALARARTSSSTSSAAGAWVLDGVKDETQPSKGMDQGSRVFSPGTIAFNGASVASGDVLTYRDGTAFNRKSSSSWTEFPTIVGPADPEIVITVSTNFQPDELPASTVSTSIGEMNNGVLKVIATGKESKSVTFPASAPRWYLANRSGPAPRMVFEVAHHGPGGDARRTYTYVWRDGAGGAGLSPALTTTASLSVQVDADKPAPKLGDTVTLSAKVSGGTGPFTYSWMGAASGATAALPFVISKPGRHDFTVIVTDAKGAKTSAAASVEAKPYIATIALAAGSLRVPIGQPLSFRAQVSSPDGTAAPAGLVYRWQPNPEARFSPVEGASPQASAVFTRLGRVKVWVDVLQPAGPALSTVAESNQLEIDVVAPTLTLSATPAQPYPGQEVRVTMTVAPEAAAELLNFRWEHTGAAISPGPLPGLREFTFAPKATSPVVATVYARARDGGDDAGSKAITITARPYVVTVTGPTLAGPAPQVWDPRSGGLMSVARQFQVFQQASMRATLTPTPPNAVRYAWTVSPDGCALSNPISQEPTISCSEAGSFTVSAAVTDGSGAALGSGSQSVSVAPQPAGTTAAPVKPPEPADRRQVASRLRTEAKALQDQGKLGEAIAKYRESLTYVPDPALEAYIKQVEAAAARQEATPAASPQTANRDKAAALRAEAKTLLDQGKLREAVTKNRESLQYVPDPALETFIKQIEDEIARREKAARDAQAAAQAANRDKVASLRAEAQALLDQGKLREAVAKVREILRYGPDPALETFVKQLEEEIARREKAPPPAPPKPPASPPPSSPPPSTGPTQPPAPKPAPPKEQPPAAPPAKAPDKPAPPPSTPAPKPPPPAPAPPPPAPKPPPAEPQGCQLNGSWSGAIKEGNDEFRAALALRQNGDRLDGTMTLTVPGMDAVTVSVGGTVSGEAIRLTFKSAAGEAGTATASVANQCRDVRLTLTIDGDTLPAISLVRR